MKSFILDTHSWIPVAGIQHQETRMKQSNSFSYQFSERLYPLLHPVAPRQPVAQPEIIFELPLRRKNLAWGNANIMFQCTLV